jgi:hypothetical protein
MKKCSTFLAIKQMQMTLKFPLIPVSMAIIKKHKQQQILPNMRMEKGTLIHC